MLPEDASAFIASEYVVSQLQVGNVRFYVGVNVNFGKILSTNGTFISPLKLAVI